MTTLSEIKQNVSVGRGLCQEVFQRKSLATSRYILPLNEPKHWSFPQWNSLTDWSIVMGKVTVTVSEPHKQVWRACKVDSSGSLSVNN